MGAKTGTEIRCVGAALLLTAGSGRLNSSVGWGEVRLRRPVKRQGVVITEGGDGEVSHSWVLFASHILFRWGRNSL